MYKYILPLLLLAAVSSCRNNEYIADDLYDNDNDPYDESQVDLSKYPDWTKATHSNAAEPNFDVVFAQDEVIRLDITISTSKWNSMLSDLSSNI
ncbi:MAG: hypothetical protein R3Y15_03190, partial [Rikenellaceae bacterium]